MVDCTKLDAAAQRADGLCRRMDGIERTLARKRVDARVMGDAGGYRKIPDYKALEAEVDRLERLIKAEKSEHGSPRMRQLHKEYEAAHSKWQRAISPRKDADPKDDAHGHHAPGRAAKSARRAAERGDASAARGV